MFRKVIAGGIVLGCMASAGRAEFVGTVDFEDGTVGALSKVIHVSNPQNFNIADFGGPGNLEFNPHGTGTGNFKSSYWLFDTSGSGAGDVYGDVTLQALFKPSNQFEIALAARVVDDPDGAGSLTSSGWGLQASNGLGGVRIGYQNTAGGTVGKGTTAAVWDNSDALSMDPLKWYELTLSVIGSTATGTVTELDGSFLPVAGHTVTVSYTDTLAEMAASGFAGTRGAQTNDAFGYVLDNVTVVPEPASMTLLGLGGLALLRRRRIA